MSETILTPELFTRLLGEPIAVRDGAGTSATVNVREVRANDAGSVQSFTVMLDGLEGEHIPQGTYIFSHSELGEHPLFVSPKSELEYELIFSRVSE
ncbi:DUF6916 family protein [Motilimonas sp. KMU-193]|uniref:DUF6916 family protein n=1 Tax=Motilimonas sp. KMU-193 TaxID=3388668 RepID=UPI00396B3F8F